MSSAAQITSTGIGPIAAVVFAFAVAQNAVGEVARVAIRVRVKTPLGLQSPAYVGVIGMDRPMSRPTDEKVAPLGVAEFHLIPGNYRLMAGAFGYPDQTITIAATSSREQPVTLSAGGTLLGVVTDAAGAPVRNAHVRDLRAGSPPGVAPVSALAAGYLGSQWSAETNESGQWQLIGPPTGKFALLIEAPGFAPALAWADPAKPLTTVLSKGGMLHAEFDRVDADAFVTLHRVDVSPTDAGWQHRVFSRNVQGKEIDWTALAAGKYQILATYLDPQYFTTPYVIGTVDVRESATAKIELKLPRRTLVRKVRKLFTPDVTTSDLLLLEPVVTGAHGTDQPRHALEQTVGGVVTYLDTEAPVSSVVLLTPDRLIVPDQRATARFSEDVTPTIVSDRAQVSLVLKPSPADSRLPLWGTVTFDACEPAVTISFAVPISKDGGIDVPYPLVCGGFVLAAPPFESSVIRTALKKGEKRTLGDVTVRIGAQIEAVVRTSSGTPVAKATVRALAREKTLGSQVSYAAGIADDEGHVSLRGIPPSTEIVLEARAPESAATGAAVVRSDPLKTVVVDPLEILPPGRVAVSAKLAKPFRSRFPAAKIESITLAADDLSNGRFDAAAVNGGKAEFNNVPAGRWKAIALVDSGTTLQPIPLDTVDVRAGEVREIDAEIDPPVFEGIVTSGGKGVAANIAFAEPAQPGSVIRFATSSPDGRFTALLALRGIYGIQVTRRDSPSETFDLGEVDMSNAALPIHLAIPDASVAIRVTRGREPVAGAQIVASLRMSRATGGFTDLRRTTESGATGEAVLSGLLPGDWLIEARDEKTSQVAQRAITVTTDKAETVLLELAAAAAFSGFVHSSSDVPVERARVDCVYSESGSAQFRFAVSDTNGHFTMDLPSDAPQILHCGVTTPAGAIAAYVLSPTTAADLRLPAGGGSLTITDWGRRLRWNEYWLVAADGRMFSLTWAGQVGGLWRPLTIRQVPAGFWKIVHAESPDALRRLASAGGNALSTAAQIQITADKPVTIELGADR